MSRAIRGPRSSENMNHTAKETTSNKIPEPALVNEPIEEISIADLPAGWGPVRILLWNGRTYLLIPLEGIVPRARV